MCVCVRTGCLHQLRVEVVGDEGVREVSEEGLQCPGHRVDRHVHQDQVQTGVYSRRDQERDRRERGEEERQEEERDIVRRERRPECVR